MPELCVNDKSPLFPKQKCHSARPRHLAKSNHAFKDKHKRKQTAKTNHAYAIGDSGTTHNLLRASHVKNLATTPCSDLHVQLPNGSSITSTHVGKMPIANSNLTSKFFVFTDHDLRQSLVSFSALCNEHDCTITLTRTDLSIRQGTKLLFHGIKEPADTLWHIDLDELTSSLISASCNNAYKTDTDAEFVAFVHASFGSPTLSTFLHAVRKGWLAKYPRLTATMVSANPPHAIATAKGHLDQTRQVKKNRRRKARHTTECTVYMRHRQILLMFPSMMIPTYASKRMISTIQCMPTSQLASQSRHDKAISIS